MKPTVIISNLGTNLDHAGGPTRWERWRPTVSLFQQDDLEPARLVLLFDPKFHKLAEQVSEDVRSVSPLTQVELVSHPTTDPWDFAEVYAGLFDFAASYPFDPDNEDYLVHMTTGTHVVQICLFLLVETGRLPGRLIQTSPPRNTRRRPAPPGTYTVIDLNLARYDSLAARFEKERSDAVDFLKSGIPTRNSAFNALMERMEQVALRSTDPMLLTGPTGVGKTALAKRIFELKARERQVGAEYVEVNCATLRGEGAMSALFGHTKGAFTGAVGAREGLLMRADGGLLFLDEIGELGLDEQAMLLRALEEGTFLPLGADRPSQSSFQLIAGTNRDLWQAVSAGTFREDLLARIDLWAFALPELRNRPEDLEPNLEFELERMGQEWNRKVAFNREARKAFLDFATGPEGLWRSNFRDFAGCLRRMGTLSQGTRIGPEHVQEEIDRLKGAWARLTGGPEASVDRVSAVMGDQPLDLFDRAQLDAVLDVVQRAKSQAEAGRELFAVSRQERSSTNDGDRLRKYLARFGLDWTMIRERLG